MEKQVYHAFDMLDTQFVAVRSSGSVEDKKKDSFAGQFETYLNVEKKQLIEKIKECYQSMLSKKAKAYCKSRGIDSKKIQMAVVIQSMIRGEISGVGFSQDPISKEKSTIIEAVVGEGKKIVDGEVTPDRYRIYAKNINKKLAGKKQILTDLQINKINKIIVALESFYKHPVDVEWTVSKGKIMILQCRPITTNSKKIGEKLIFAFREYMPLFSTSKLEYSTRDYVIITKKKQSECYYIGEQINFFKRDKKKINNLIFKFEKSNREIKEFKLSLGKNPDIKILIKTFKKIMGMLKRRSDVYQLTEESYRENQKIDKKLAMRISKLRLESKVENKKNWKILFCEILPGIAKKIGVSTRDVTNYTYDEIIVSMTKKPAKKTIERRKKIRGLIQIKGKRRFLNNMEIKKITTEIKRIQKVKKELLGDVVYPGVVKGRVYIVKSACKIKNSQIKKNSILVTPMIRPNIIEYINKFKGVITDEGGILSHAAIIAREQKIPCIIGTHVASKRFKNGDMIELDANNGTIRKL